MPPEEDKPTAWFEPLYSAADEQGSGVPWANMSTQPSFQAWLDKHDLNGQGKSALVIGCGMGDDAIELESRGFTVTAFDVSESAIDHCRRRFPDTTVDFQTADLFGPPPAWKHRFDFVLEIYTIQALPPKYEDTVLPTIAGFVAPGGRLLAVAIVGDGPRSFDAGPPWALTKEHVSSFESQGLTVSDQFIREKPSKRGDDVWVTTYTRNDT
jgi:SAM-dependent methyltransferase